MIIIGGGVNFLYSSCPTNINKSNYQTKYYKILEKGIPIQEQIKETNTTYEIKFDFDLKGKILELSQNCILKFTGGCLINGGIIANNNKIITTNDKTIFHGIKKIGKSNFIGNIKDYQIQDNCDNEKLKLLFSFDTISISKDYQLTYEKIKIDKSITIFGDHHNISILSKNELNHNKEIIKKYGGFTINQNLNATISIYNLNIHDKTPKGVYGIKDKKHIWGSRNSIIDLGVGNSILLDECSILTRGTCITCWGNLSKSLDKGKFIKIQKSHLSANMFCIENGCRSNVIQNSIIEIYDEPYYGGDVLSNLGNLNINNSTISGSIESSWHNNYDFSHIDIKNSILTPWFGIAERGDNPIISANVNIENCHFKFKSIPINSNGYVYKSTYKRLLNLTINKCIFDAVCIEKWAAILNFSCINKITLTNNIINENIFLSTFNYDTIIRCQEDIKAIYFDNNTLNLKFNNLFCLYKNQDYKIIKSTKPTNKIQNNKKISSYHWSKSNNTLIKNDDILKKLFLEYN